MDIKKLKSWAIDTGNVELVAELVHAGTNIESALEYVYDIKTLSKKEFVSKYYGNITTK